MSRSDVVTLSEHVEERSRLTLVDRLTRSVCLVAALACVLIAGLLALPRIQAERRQLELVVGENEFDDMPPGITLPTVMLSTFRGLVIHFLWTRSEELKQEGRYYELQQLSDWICELQPRYPKVWENAAWNMAYNISVGTYSERERWYWVSAGAFLLRDQGIPLNPTAIQLYKELAWIFLHKMGDFMDDHHWAYKRNWAVITERVLGQPPAEAEDEQVIAAVREIADAAAAIKQIGPLGKSGTLQLFFSQEEATDDLGRFMDRLAAIGYQPDAAWLEAVARHDRRGLQLSDLVVKGTAPTDSTVQEFKELMADPDLATARRRLLAAVRAHVLRSELRLDPEFMLAQMERFGPLDWRTVYTQGLYWAAMGARECQETIGLDENVEMNTHRFIQFAIKDTCERGQLVFEPDFADPFSSFIVLLPDYRFADELHELYLEQAETLRPKHEPKEVYYREGPAGRLFKSGHVNFLHTAVRELYLGGHLRKAQQYYDYLREQYKEPNGQTKPMYQTTLEEFVLSQYFDDIDSFKQGPVLIHTMLNSAYLYLAYQRPREAARRVSFARQGYDRFMKDKLKDRSERRKIPPWPDVKASAFENFILRYPLPRAVNLVYKARTWDLVDNATKLEIYDRVEDQLLQACRNNQPELDPMKAFPPPKGLEEHRRGAPKRSPAEEEKDFREMEIDEGSKR